jgi:hypothetical protein
VVDEPVDHGCGDDVVAEDLAPAAEGLVGRDDQAGAFVVATSMNIRRSRRTCTRRIASSASAPVTSSCRCLSTSRLSSGRTCSHPAEDPVRHGHRVAGSTDHRHFAEAEPQTPAPTELAEPRYAGSALTLQLALGFALTIASIRLVPVAADIIGWRYALLPLAAGPLSGTVAMLRLRASPAARRLAGEVLEGRPL